MQALYEMQEQLARIGAQMCRITEDLVDNDGIDCPYFKSLMPNTEWQKEFE